MSRKSKGRGSHHHPRQAVPAGPPPAVATSPAPHHPTMAAQASTPAGATASGAQGFTGGSAAAGSSPASPKSVTARAQDVAQQRAAHAWAVIKKIETCPAEAKDFDAHAKKKDFGSHAKKLPMRIRAAGLGQALAFVRAKAKAKEKEGKRKEGLVLLLQAVGGWVLPRLKPDGDITGTPALASDDALIDAILGGDSIFLRRATLETLAYLEWLNRFAEAEGLGDGDDTERE